MNLKELFLCHNYYVLGRPVGAGVPNNNMLCILTSEWVLKHTLNTESIFSTCFHVFHGKRWRFYLFFKSTQNISKNIWSV